MGLSNYTMKKMIPRLVVAAILVNASFYIAAAAVDVSNLLGYNIINLFEAIEVSDVGTNPNDMYTEIIGTVLGAGVGVAFIALIITAPATLLALAVIALILVARKALIILLIVVAPIAFVAYLLPNTESWFKKWYKMFIALLMVFPVIAAVFGASTLASEVLMSIANAGDVEADGPDQVLYIIALGVAAIPLFAVPALLKGSLAAAGSIGAKISGMGDKSTGYAKKKAMEGRVGEAKAAFDRGRQNSKFRRRAGEGAITKWGENRGGRLGRTVAFIGTRQRAFDNSALGMKLGGTRGAAVATQGIHKQFDDDVAAFKTTMTSMSNETLVEKLRNGEGSEEYQAALAGTIMSRDHRDSHIAALQVMGQRARAAEASGNSRELESVTSIEKQMAHDMRDKPWALGDKAAGQLVNGTYGMSRSHTGEQQDQYGAIYEELKHRVGTKLSAKSLAEMNPDEMRDIWKMATGNWDPATDAGKPHLKLSDDELANLKAKIRDIKTSRYKDDIKPEAQRWFNEIEGL